MPEIHFTNGNLLPQREFWHLISAEFLKDRVYDFRWNKKN